MDRRKALVLILQFLQEEDFQLTKATLEKESNIDLEDESLPEGSELMRILNEHAELQFAMMPAKPTDPNLLQGGDIETIPATPLKTLSGFHNSNILTVRFSSLEPNILASGGSDRTLKIIDYEASQLLWESQHHKAPILSVDFHPSQPNLILTSSMDQTVTLLDYQKRELIKQFNNNSKYVTRVQWCPTQPSSSLIFATASHDRTVHIYKNLEVAKDFHFNNCVEAMTFTPDGKTIIVSVRESNYLTLIDVETYQLERKNMNENGDDHVSFTALDIVCSPDGKYLLVATDKDRVIMYNQETFVQLKNFYGSQNDSFSQPRLCFHPSLKFIFSTSQNNKIAVWDIVSQRLVKKIEGHTALPRDLHFHPTKNLLVTCSFDKTIRLWS